MLKKICRNIKLSENHSVSLIELLVLPQGHLSPKGSLELGHWARFDTSPAPREGGTEGLQSRQESQTSCAWLESRVGHLVNQQSFRVAP